MKPPPEVLLAVGLIVGCLVCASASAFGQSVAIAGHHPYAGLPFDTARDNCASAAQLAASGMRPPLPLGRMTGSGVAEGQMRVGFMAGAEALDGLCRYEARFSCEMVHGNISVVSTFVEKLKQNTADCKPQSAVEQSLTDTSGPSYLYHLLLVAAALIIAGTVSVPLYRAGHPIIAIPVFIVLAPVAFVVLVFSLLILAVSVHGLLSMAGIEH